MTIPEKTPENAYLNLQVWANALDQIARQPAVGHSYVGIKRHGSSPGRTFAEQSDVQLFASKEELEQAGYQSLKIQELHDITQKLFNREVRKGQRGTTLPIDDARRADFALLSLASRMRSPHPVAALAVRVLKAVERRVGWFGRHVMPLLRKIPVIAKTEKRLENNPRDLHDLLSNIRSHLKALSAFEQAYIERTWYADLPDENSSYDVRKNYDTLRADFGRTGHRLHFLNERNETVELKQMIEDLPISQEEKSRIAGVGSDQKHTRPIWILLFLTQKIQPAKFQTVKEAILSSPHPDLRKEESEAGKKALVQHWLSNRLLDEIKQKTGSDLLPYHVLKMIGQDMAGLITNDICSAVDARGTSLLDNPEIVPIFDQPNAAYQIKLEKDVVHLISRLPGSIVFSSAPENSPAIKIQGELTITLPLDRKTAPTYDICLTQLDIPKEMQRFRSYFKDLKVRTE